MSRTITPETYTVYSFDELSEEAKRVAISRVQTSDYCGWDWQEEWEATIHRACIQFGLRYDDSDVSQGCVSITVADEDVRDLRGVRLWKWLHNNGIADDIAVDCPWTGYIGDENFLDPIRAFLVNPDEQTDYAQLMYECAQSWAQAWQADIEWQRSDECIAEYLANGVEFLSNGVIA